MEGDWFSVEHDCPGVDVLGAYAFGQSSGKYVTSELSIYSVQIVGIALPIRAAKVRGRLPLE
jgi:hypothetical protein